MNNDDLEFYYSQAHENLQNIIILSKGETDKEYNECISNLVSAWNNLEDRFKIIRVEKMSKSIHGEPEFEQR